MGNFEQFKPDVVEIGSEAVEKNESMDSVYKKSVEDGVEKALGLVASRFENQEDEKENLDFHNTRHTNEVVKNTEAILNAIGVTEKEVNLGKLIASYHDTVQEWEENVTDDGKIMRKRAISDNEAASFVEFEQYVKDVNSKEGTEVFSEGDIETGRFAIMGTVPGFDPEKGTVVQPNMTNEAPKVARAVALADLGTAGIEGSEKYVEDGSSLFREENLDIAEKMANPDQLTEEEKEGFKQRMLGWSNFQPIFANGRKELFESEIDGFGEEEKDGLRNLFNKFDESIKGAKEVAEAREEMSFEEISASMGYESE